MSNNETHNASARLQFILRTPIQVEKFDGTEACAARLKLKYSDSDVETDAGPMAIARWYDSDDFIVYEGQWVAMFPDGCRGLINLQSLYRHYRQLDAQEELTVLEFAKLHQRLDNARFNFDELQKKLEQYISKNVELRNQVDVLEKQLSSMQRIMEHP
jgi:hypothetical protein